MKALLLFIFVTVQSVGLTFCQNATLIGKIVDSKSGKAISNAEVVVKGNTQKTNSNYSGYFQLTGDSLEVTISHPSFVTVDLKMNSSNPKVLVKMPMYNYDLPLLELKGQLSFDEPFLYKKEAWASAQEDYENKEIQEGPPQFPGGTEEFHLYLIENIAFAKGLIKRKFETEVEFLITKEGTIENVTLSQPTENDSILIGIYTESPKWIPSYRFGQPICTLINQKIVYHESFEFFAPVDTYPEYTSGMGGFFKVVNSNLNYPKEARKNDIEGQVKVSFVVNKEGVLEEVETIEGLGFGCDEEAERLIMLTSGKWKAGTQKGRPVKVRMIIPVTFKISL